MSSVRSLIALLLVGSSAASAQMRTALQSSTEPRSASVLLRPANLSVRHVSLTDAMRALSRRSGVSLAYSPNLLPDDEKKVSCACENLSVGDALKVLLAESPLSYIVDHDQVVIFPRVAAQDGPFAYPAAAAPPGPSGGLVVNSLVLPTPRVHVQQAVITGVVLAAETQEPLTGVQIVVVGTTNGAVTDAQGRFRIDGLSGEEVTLRVELIGYRTMTVRARPGDPAIQILLEQTAIGLEQIVVTATGEQRLVEVGSSIGRVRADSAMLVAPVTNLAELISSRAAGVFVKTGSGSSIGGSKIRIRGSSSPSRDNEPIVYIDGVRVNTDPTSGGTNQQVPSRFNDINPNEIETIDILKGPSASTMYGTEAANGVILITTKSGAGATRKAEWHVWTEGGRITEPNEYPANYRGVNAQGASCPLTSQAAGACTQAELRSFNLVMDPSTTVFKTGRRGVLGASVTGSSADFNYFVSGEYESENGVYVPDRLRRTFVRGNFTLRPTDQLQVQVSTGYLSSNLGLFADGGTTLGLVTTGWAGTADPNGWFLYTPEQLYQRDTRQHVDRLIGSATVRLQPANWLQLRGVIGLDGIWRDDEALVPVGIFPGAAAEGTRSVERNNAIRYSAEALAVLSFPLSQTLSSRTSIGGQFFRDRGSNVTASGSQLVPGTNSLGAAALRTGSESSSEMRNLGAFIEQQVSYRDRVFVNGGVRSDNNSSFGTQAAVIVYPKIGASWAISEEPFFPQSTLLNSLRVRAAWGQSGSQPGALNAVLFYSSSPATMPGGQSRIGVTVGGMGNPQLKAERSSETELGFDLGMLDDRIVLGLTRYDIRTEDVLVFRNIAPSVGGTTGRWENLGATENKGYEASVDANILEYGNVKLDLTVSGMYNRNKLLELGEGVSPINTGTNQRHVEGYPMGGYWMRDVGSFDDANGDGIIVNSEVTATDTAVYLGEVTPPYIATVQPTLELFKHLRLTGVLAFNYGHKLYNFSEGFRCNNANARGRNDIATPLAEQARCVAHALLAVPGGYVEDAGFTKLRELGATLYVPEAWTAPTGVGRVSLTVAGHNLGTWTSYSGVDPDISSRGTNFSMVDFFQPANRRLWIARVNVTF
jgi:TonB-linked SusC/RagA family outer membrane protein